MLCFSVSCRSRIGFQAVCHEMPRKMAIGSKSLVSRRDLIIFSRKKITILPIKKYAAASHGVVESRVCPKKIQLQEYNGFGG